MAAAKPLPDLATLHRLVRYEGETGRIYWRQRDNVPSWNATYAGREAGTLNKATGYVSVGLLGQRYQAHRIIMALSLGRDPTLIDHINGNRSDNRLENMREASASENSRNQRVRVNNSSGVTGVVLEKQTGRWRAQIKNLGKCHHLGSFGSFDEAVAARKAAEQQLGFHANHGKEGKMETRRILKRRPTHRDDVPGGFIDVTGERWSKTPDGYRPNSEIMPEMTRDFA